MDKYGTIRRFLHTSASPENSPPWEVDGPGHKHTRKDGYALNDGRAPRHALEHKLSPKDANAPMDGHALRYGRTPRRGHAPMNDHNLICGYARDPKHSPDNRHPPEYGQSPEKGCAFAIGCPTDTPKGVPVRAEPATSPNKRITIPEQSSPRQHALVCSPPIGLTTAQPVVSSTPHDVFAGTPLETFTASNLQLVASLAKQSLPKCHPDVFDGDVAMFHSWKRSFKAMVRDADIVPEQELNYLRSFTSGDPQQLVDNFRKRQGDNPTATLANLWGELERRFGNAAALTQALIERLCTAATLSHKDNVKLQKLADLCADVDCQMALLPGLACLNYPIALRPIIERLPAYLKTKWEKKIVDYAEAHNDAYPTFREFSAMIEDQARKRNHPNLYAGTSASISSGQNHFREDNKGRIATKTGTETRRVLKNSATLASERVLTKVSTRMPGEKRCIFHDRDGHWLTECKAFEKKTVKEREHWIYEKGLCFRCFSPDHKGNACRENIKCSTCGSARHPDLLHLGNREKKEVKDNGTSEESTENVSSMCTSICEGNPGGLSCSKIVLVDVYRENAPDKVHRVYAIVDDQSNASMITAELADELNAVGPEWRYFLSTCGGTREVRYGRRVAGLIVRSVHGSTSRLPTLTECDSIPQEKGEIPTPEIAMRHSHLRTEYTGTLSIHDQKPAKHAAHRPYAQVNTQDGYEVIQCSNKFKINQSYEGYRDNSIIPGSVYQVTANDNDVGLSVEDCRFIKIMERSTRKNKHGNWEMPLPFRLPNVVMPNNRSYAAKRLNGLLRILKRKPQMQKDYVEFMGKILDKGHAVRVPPD